MFSLKTVILAIAAAASVNADYYINPDSVALSTRKQWCSSELSSCPLICKQSDPGKPIVNTCDPTTLQYGCVCGNNLQPNVSEYTLTMPYFVCQEWGIQCVKSCGSDNTCASSCQQDHPCGALSPQRQNTSTITTQSSTSATSSANQIFTGLSSSGSSSSGSTSGGSPNLYPRAPAIQAVGVTTGLLVLTGGLFAGFAVMF